MDTFGPVLSFLINQTTHILHTLSTIYFLLLPWIKYIALNLVEYVIIDLAIELLNARNYTHEKQIRYLARTQAKSVDQVLIEQELERITNFIQKMKDPRQRLEAKEWLVMKIERIEDGVEEDAGVDERYREYYHDDSEDEWEESHGEQEGVEEVVHENVCWWDKECEAEEWDPYQALDNDSGYVSPTTLPNEDGQSGTSVDTNDGVGETGQAETQQPDFGYPLTRASPCGDGCSDCMEAERLQALDLQETKNVSPPDQTLEQEDRQTQDGHSESYTDEEQSGFQDAVESRDSPEYSDNTNFELRNDRHLSSSTNQNKAPHQDKDNDENQDSSEYLEQETPDPNDRESNQGDEHSSDEHSEQKHPPSDGEDSDTDSSYASNRNLDPSISRTYSSSLCIPEKHPGPPYKRRYSIFWDDPVYHFEEIEVRHRIAAMQEDFDNAVPYDFNSRASRRRREEIFGAGRSSRPSKRREDRVQPPPLHPPSRYTPLRSSPLRYSPSGPSTWSEARSEDSREIMREDEESKEIMFGNDEDEDWEDVKVGEKEGLTFKEEVQWMLLKGQRRADGMERLDDV